ncbi:MAG: hypothetical protein Satyrvirus6_29 [Satyrvirus sp.]|uniref:Ankyrin repeat protein n=1 Tax=Satyrvirus sp. TaxID=2487771 RepID=A0A3G5ADF8_9VIRU|nr:MAG: hypothetical protein Satyrvirus6_29 [Satyrvirus sp.]
MNTLRHILLVSTSSIVQEGDPKKFIDFMDRIVKIDNNENVNIFEFIFPWIVSYDKPGFLNILIEQFEFELTSEYVKNNIIHISFSEKLFDAINNLFGTNIWENLDTGILKEIFKKAYRICEINILKKLIDFGFNINNLTTSDKIYLLEITVDYHYDVLQFLIDNGFGLEFIDNKILAKLIYVINPKILKLLAENGVNLGKINSMNIPEHLDKYYNLLMEMNIDPKIIVTIYYNGSCNTVSTNCSSS